MTGWEHVGALAGGGGEVYVKPVERTHEDVRYEGGCCDGTITVTLFDVPVEQDPEGAPYRTFNCYECEQPYRLERISPYLWRAPPGERD